jgi:phospholipase C
MVYRNPTSTVRHVVVGLTAALLLLGSVPVRADGNLQNLNHIIIVMQENRSFDNYFGVLAYVPGSPYHSATGAGPKRACEATDHTCVDGLSCRVNKKTGALNCRNSNKSNGPGRVRAFHDPRYCTGPDLDHGWVATHQEANFSGPNNTLKATRSNGFVRVNAETEAPIQAIDHDTMGYYTDSDLPFYYGLAETFAIDDRYFAAVLGPTFPNRSYLAAATSFGHLSTSETITAGGYKPITGTIFQLLDQNNVSWTDYFSDLPYSLVFGPDPPHQQPIAQFAIDAAAGTLPAVAFVDPSAFPDQIINGISVQTDEHPPNDIRAGEYFVSTIVSALRNSASWNDSLLFITYDEHGGCYDHVAPPPAPQAGAPTPDGIAPGQCADLSNPPASEQPGGGATCNASKTSAAPGLCPGFTPTGPYPAKCATFNQLGFRLPFIAVSPFAKPRYVSHTIGDHTSLLALIEKRFLNGAHLTARDHNSNTLEDMFDFDTSPSLTSTIPSAPLPALTDPGCPFS